MTIKNIDNFKDEIEDLQIRKTQIKLNLILLSFFSLLFLKPNRSNTLRKSFLLKKSSPTGIYLLQVNKRNTITTCKISSKLTIKTPEQRHWRLSGVFIVNFEQMLRDVLVFPLLTLNKKMPGERSVFSAKK